MDHLRFSELSADSVTRHAHCSESNIQRTEHVVHNVLRIPANRRTKYPNPKALEQRHHAKIGQLTLEVDWLKKKHKQRQIPLDGDR